MDKRNNLGMIMRVTVVVLIVAAIVLALHRRIAKSLYSERQEMLTLVTNTSATIFNQSAQKEWEAQGLFSDIVRRDLPAASSVESFIDGMNEAHDFGGDYYFFVDTDGKYYSSDGAFGKLHDFANFITPNDGQTAFLSTLPHKDPDDVFLIYREKLDKNIRIHSDQGDAEIAFFAYAHDLKALRKDIDEQFPGAINVFIYDAEGVMLYKQFGLDLLIEGINIYPKFEKSKRVFGEDPDELISRCRNKETIVVELDIAGERYYFCSAPLDLVDWSLAFITPTSSFNTSRSTSFSGVNIYVALIALILGVALLMLMYSSMKRKTDAERLKTKTDFLSNMSHDIRTPINGIMGMTNIAQSSIDNPAKVKDCLGKIDSASHHLLSLINDVLDMSRIESGKTTIETKPADISMICNNCCSIIKGQMAGRDLEFNYDIYAEHTRILADDLHLRQVFINILGNAVKFTKDGGKIWFSCRETNSSAEKVSFRFEVRDTGIGMSKDYIKHIFEAFSQEDAGDRTKYKGTGLGMSITKQLVDLMGGTIEVFSEQGMGTTFTVILTFDRDLQATVDEKKTVASDFSIQDIKILLVEDNELNSEIATELLSTCGAMVDTAFDGLAAVEKFTSHPAGTYDVILMDIMMPKMNGLEATRAIRALDRKDARTIPILAMTANAFDDDVKATQEAGMNAHLSKPIDIQEVIRAISFHVTR